MKLFFYTSLGCHLCEHARDIIDPYVGNGETLELEEIEIANDDNLLDRYGIKIPVIKLESCKEELEWPFDAGAFQAYLERSRST